MRFFPPSQRASVTALLVVLTVGACSSGESPVAPGSTADSPAISLQGRVVDLFSGAGIPGLRVTQAGRSVVTDAQGAFSLSATSGGTVAVSVSGGGIYTRETFVTGDQEQLRVVPSSFDMAAFDDVARERGETARWLSRPAIYVDAGGHDLPAGSDPAAWAAEVASSASSIVSGWTGGALSPASVTVGTAPPNEGAAGTIVVRFDEDPAQYPSSRTSGLTQVYRGSSGEITAAVIRLRLSPLTSAGAGVARKALLTHELGHALGLGHMDGSTSSIMAPSIRVFSPTDFDREAGALLYHRPPGNVRVDKDDLSGFRAALQGAAGGETTILEEWACAWR